MPYRHLRNLNRNSSMLLAELTKDDPKTREEQAAQIEAENDSTAFLEQLEAKRQRVLEVARETARQLTQ